MPGMRSLSAQEIARIDATLAASGHRFAPRNRALFAAGVATGGRIGELVQLRIGDVYGAGGVPLPVVTFIAKITKGGYGPGTVPVSPEARAAFAAYWPHRVAQGQAGPGDPLFLSRKGNGILDPRSGARILEEACAAAGVEGRVGSHSMRKTRGMSLLRAGAPMPVIQRALRQRDVRSTQAYLEVDPEMLRPYVEAADARLARGEGETPVITLPVAG